MPFNSPLRYPGGKGKLTNFIKKVVEENDLFGGHYVEAYAGGGGIALNLLLHNYASQIYLNDLNLAVYAFWYSVINSTDELCKSISDVRVDMAEWHKQRKIFDKPGKKSHLELGFSTFFLNRTNRSGILKAGVIGGRNQDGAWKIDARFNKKDLIRRIEKIAQCGSRIRLSNLDAQDFMQQTLPTLPPKSLVYLDPPYYVKGQGLYEDHYTHEDHTTVAEYVQSKIKQPWIVSYDNAPEIVEMYKKRQAITYGINYSAQNRYEGAEAMFFSDKLSVPTVKNPAKVKSNEILVLRLE